MIVLAVLLAIPAIAALILMTHTQIIAGAIQKLSASTVNTINSDDPLGEPMEGLKDNGQYIITEVKYSEDYPNSFLDITYPDENRETSRPTLIYFHGGGFFGGSKSVGDPLAESDATALLDDICAEGFNLVNIDYVLVPEYHFPAPLVQANEAFQFLTDHADEYHLDMDRVVIMGSSAGAVLTLCMWIAARTKLGELAVTDHCRNAVGEMQYLDECFQEMRKQNSAFRMPCFDALRSRMPSWNELHLLCDQNKDTV